MVTKTENHNIIPFTAEECEEYIWTFENTVIGREQACKIDTLVLYKGIYTLYLEAKKGNNYYSYFAQIEVLFDKALVATASTIDDVLQAMTESGTVYVTGRVTIADIRNINTALKNLQASKPDILVSLNLSKATGFSMLEDASETNANYAFYNCTNLKEIILHNSIRTIGKNAFNGCSNLTSIHILSYTESIGEGAFKNCTNLVSVTMASSGVRRIENYAFSNCKKLTDISLPSSLQRIGEYAFSGCSSLSYIKMPSNLSRIEAYAFKDCTSLTKALFSHSSDWKAGNTSMNPSNFLGSSLFEEIFHGNFAQLLKGNYVSRVWRVPYLD